MVESLRIGKSFFKIINKARNKGAHLHQYWLNLLLREKR